MTMTSSEIQQEISSAYTSRGVIRQAFTAYGKNFFVLFAFALMPEVLFFLAERSVLITSFALFGGAGLLWVVAFGATISVVSRHYMDPPVSVAGSFARALVKLPYLVVAAFVFVAALIGSALMSVVIIGMPIFLSLLLAWFLAAPAIFVDDENPLSAIKKSRGLIRGNWWSTLRVVATAGFFTLSLVAISASAALLIPDATVGGVVAVILSALAFPIIPISASFKYLELRDSQVDEASEQDEVSDDVEADDSVGIDSLVLATTVVSEVLEIEHEPVPEVLEIEIDPASHVEEPVADFVSEVSEGEPESVRWDREIETESIAASDEVENVLEQGVWQCLVCESVYDPKVGDDANGFPPGTAFDDLPDEWECPSCGTTKDWFENVDLKSQGLESAYGEVRSGD